ncbi:hypothetical protein HO133_005876 [Letharia lupina]|uniref:Prion-inhibition and propagation HeLo domain-containing protein n=1 Tax=Letharia lupina TaxID=560253 RepID=A0A8H6F7W2_9LECA|nr:uncharacterized protein HO133_005876 [Letharia lupina]KAF6218527.1 hypothetical protein HO133_005876 [Letharia lupina]
MVDPIGTTLGAASLTLQLLDGCIKGYKYFIAAAGMPEDCRYMRVKLQIEYSRLLDWCEVAGLIELKDGQDLPDSLRANKLTLVAILTEIRVSMEDLAGIRGKYVDFNSAGDTASEKAAIETDLLGEFSHLAISYEKEPAQRNHPRSRNYIARGTSMASKVVKHPKRLQWVLFDKDVFLKLLGRLTELNHHLQELMQGHQARALEIATQKTYLEMVQMRASVAELAHLVTAAMLLQEHHGVESSSASTGLRNQKALASLATFKSLNATHDVLVREHSGVHQTNTSPSQFYYSQIYYDNGSALASTSDSRIRTEGKLYSGHGTEQHVWIEWKGYNTKHDRGLEKHVPLPKNLKRVKELVSLLQSDKPKQFHAPRCLGFFDDRDDIKDSNHDARFGLVFEKPENSASPVSLRQIMFTRPKASLTDRISLAHKLSTCVLYLHAVNWLHKGLRSDGVIFFPDSDTPSITEPYVTGYEYARPDKDGQTTTTTVEFADYLMLYVHPNYQGSDAKGTYRKTFDIYSLGIILLEIAYWKPIEQILDIDTHTAKPAQLKAVRERLLEPGSGYLAFVKENLGERYYTAVKSCIEGRAAFGIGTDEVEGDVQTGARLQHGFSTLVVDALESISI